MAYDLEFEKPLADLANKIHTLRKRGAYLPANEQSQLQHLEQELHQLTSDIYRNLTVWQTVLVARHPQRPHTIDYIRLLCDDFFELHGDRLSADNQSIVGGLATFARQTVMIIGHEKGRERKEKQQTNAGQPHPAGFRKAYRLMQHAEKFSFPLLCLIDTPGASIALEDEERGQSQSIAANIHLLSRLRIPVIAAVIGEGGSGGALALSLADRLLMQEYTYYSVASPESAAMILTRHEKYAAEMAQAMRINARQLHHLGLIDELIPEPLGGAHCDYEHAARALKSSLSTHLNSLRCYSIDDLLTRRYHKFRSLGTFTSLT